MSHLLYISFHLECPSSLFFPWPFITKYSPSTSNPGCQQLPVLSFALLHSLHDFHSSITLYFRFFRYFEASRLGLMVSYWLASPYIKLPRLFQVFGPLLSFTLSNPRCALYYPSVIRGSRNIHLGNLFQKGHSIFYSALDSVFIEVRYKCHIHYCIPSIQHNVTHARFLVNRYSLNILLTQERTPLLPFAHIIKPMILICWQDARYLFYCLFFCFAGIVTLSSIQCAHNKLHEFT